jgi:hypothetical protein
MSGVTWCGPGEQGGGVAWESKKAGGVKPPLQPGIVAVAGKQNRWD